MWLVHSVGILHLSVGVNRQARHTSYLLIFLLKWSCQTHWKQQGMTVIQDSEKSQAIRPVPRSWLQHDIHLFTTEHQRWKNDPSLCKDSDGQHCCGDGVKVSLRKPRTDFYPSCEEVSEHQIQPICTAGSCSSRLCEPNSEFWAAFHGEKHWQSALSDQLYEFCKIPRGIPWWWFQVAWEGALSCRAQVQNMLE